MLELNLEDLDLDLCFNYRSRSRFALQVLQHVYSCYTETVICQVYVLPQNKSISASVSAIITDTGTTSKDQGG